MNCFNTIEMSLNNQTSIVTSSSLDSVQMYHLHKHKPSICDGCQDAVMLKQALEPHINVFSQPLPFDP
jgi:hypothetical protein